MKNDFCVEEMMETQFPHLNQFIREDYPTTTEAIDEWFKRMIDDFPTVSQILEERPNDWEWTGSLVGRRNKWFEKWLSQFKEDSEE